MHFSDVTAWAIGVVVLAPKLEIRLGRVLRIQVSCQSNAGYTYRHKKARRTTELVNKKIN